MAHSVAIVGASGFVGGELLRLIAQHPELEVATVTANSSAGSKLADLHPHLAASYPNLVVEATSAEHLAKADIVFLAMPHGESGALGERLTNRIVIDCGADHRLVSEADWQQFYGGQFHEPWPYGMPELTLASGGKLRGRLRDLTRIAVPGCNVTAVTLALAPGLTAALLEPTGIEATLAVGVSGAGKTPRPDLLAAAVQGSARAYGVGGTHRHIPEIQQNLTAAAGKPVEFGFTPILVPMNRGILAVCSANLAPGADLSKLRAAYADAYGDEPFIQVVSEQPMTASVTGSNQALIAIEGSSQPNRVTITCVIDNLVKGTAGAAIQTLNLALGLPETTGLTAAAVAP